MIVRLSPREVLNGHRHGDTRWITGTVALIAICVFAISGAQILPSIVASHGHSAEVAPGQVTALLLNMALILFAWRRSIQLKATAEQRNAAEDIAYRLAYFDELTGLLNRRRLKELLDVVFSGAVGSGTLILIDLDRFKRINDLHGHAIGDRLLATAARRIRDNCPPDAGCFRLGGDEFAVLLQGQAARAKDAALLADSLVEILSEPIAIGNTTAAVGCSIGIVSTSKKCRTPEALLERADFAMYEAKRLGRNRSVTFDSAMEAQLQQRRKFEGELKEGIECGQFVPYFQPIFDLVSTEVIGFEVLARWRHPERGLLEPAEFIETAERTGMISDLSFAVMREALEIARGWPDRFRITVNVTPVQFSDPLIAQRILKMLSLTGFPPARLEIEIMERSLLEDLPMATATITSLKNAGVSISVDDFGIGYGALSQLKPLPFDRIKIDRSYVASLLDDDGCDVLVQAIAALGKGLRLPVTAEGVEAESLRARLLELGCSNAQGWVFAHALSAKEIVLGFGSNWDHAVPARTQEANDATEPRRTAGL